MHFSKGISRWLRGRNEYNPYSYLQHVNVILHLFICYLLRSLPVCFLFLPKVHLGRSGRNHPSINLHLLQTGICLLINDNKKAFLMPYSVSAVVLMSSCAHSSVIFSNPFLLPSYPFQRRWFTVYYGNRLLSRDNCSRNYTSLNWGKMD